MPSDDLDAETLVAIFKDRGFTSEDLVALVGAHSCGANLSYFPFDTTPGVMDSPTYYTEVLRGDAPAILPSDKNLALSPVTTNYWQEYARDQNAWDIDYITA